MINLSSNTLGFDEVVDSLGDALTVTEKVHAALADGIGVTDIGTIFQITPLLNEIIRDRDTFVAQFADLTPEESQAVAEALVLQHGGSADVIVQKALAALDLASDWHVAIQANISLVQRTVDFGKGLFKKAA